MTSRPKRSRSAALGLGSLFTSLLAGSVAGCSFDGDIIGENSCPDDPGTRVVTREFEVEASKVAAAGPNADGVIPATACSSLCVSEFGGKALSCRDLGPANGSPTGGLGGMSGSAGGAGGMGGSAGGAGGISAGGAGGMGGAGAAFRDVECELEEPIFCVGRRHVGVDGALAAKGPTEVAAWLARTTASEAISVPAFLALAEELRGHGAPPELVAEAERAAADEVRHAASMRDFAQKAGAPLQAAPPQAQPVHRSLFELALENATEGCVHETFSGLLAMHQARCAADADFRATMSTIADEEVSHGELAWAIHTWACQQLSANEVRRLQLAMHEAAERMIEALASERLHAETRQTLGLPSAATSAKLASSLRPHLWAA